MEGSSIASSAKALPRKARRTTGMWRRESRMGKMIKDELLILGAAQRLD